jgi:predicted NAD/FAD-binding protein
MMRIAIIGSGISGLVAGYYLHRLHDITLFEADDRIGGHNNTVECQSDGERLNVDTGFIVYNERTYPNFIRLLNELDVETQPTRMSFSVSCETTGLEYNGTGLNGLFAQRRNLVSSKFWRLLVDFRRFGKLARAQLNAEDSNETVGEFLSRNQFSRSFIRHYFLPMGAAIWSASFDAFSQFPIRFIAEFYHNHGLLDVVNRPQWRVITGGSKQYLGPLTNGWSERIRTSSPVVSVRRGQRVVSVTVANEQPAEFDHVIFACHSDQALRILEDDARPLEHEVLSAFPYQSNIATLHTDKSVLPDNHRAWAGWNYFCPRSTPDRPTVTYNMNMLQSLKTRQTFCVTLNDDIRIDPEKIIRTFEYTHPTFSVGRREMQNRHHELIDQNRTSFCGAYWRNGFHEDGVVSALRVVNQLVEPASACEIADYAREANAFE